MSKATYGGLTPDELRALATQGIPLIAVRASAVIALLDRIASLEADNARRRGALEAVFNRLDDVPDSWAAAGVQARAIARNVLEQEARDGE